MYDKAMKQAGIKENGKCYFVGELYLRCKTAPGFTGYGGSDSVLIGSR